MKVKEFVCKVVEAKKLEASLQCFICFCFLSRVMVRDRNRQRQDKDGIKMERQNRVGGGGEGLLSFIGLMYIF